MEIRGLNWTVTSSDIGMLIEGGSVRSNQKALNAKLYLAVTV